MYFPAAKSLFGKTTSYVKAVDDVSFEVEKGKTFGLVGESGCGKTTTGKCILRITDPTEGHICYKGKDISRASKEEIKSIRREIQLIFQDPYGSLDPRQSAYSIIKEAVVTGKEKYTESEVAARVKELLEIVELLPEMGVRYPHEMSGGQRQRLGSGTPYCRCDWSHVSGTYCRDYGCSGNIFESCSSLHAGIAVRGAYHGLLCGEK